MLTKDEVIRCPSGKRSKREMTDKAMRMVDSVLEYLASCWTTLYLLPSACFPSPEIYFHNRRFKILKLVRLATLATPTRLFVQLGEGGYSFIYLVKELATTEHPFVAERCYAIKMVLSHLLPTPLSMQHCR